MSEAAPVEIGLVVAEILLVASVHVVYVIRLRKRQALLKAQLDEIDRELKTLPEGALDRHSRHRA